VDAATLTSVFPMSMVINSSFGSSKSFTTRNAAGIPLSFKRCSLTLDNEKNAVSEPEKKAERTKKKKNRIIFIKKGSLSVSKIISTSRTL
jgi:hypothetical protein